MLYSSDPTPTVEEMKRYQEDGDDHQEDDDNDKKWNEETLTGKGITELLYGMCSAAESAGSERLREKLILMCNIITESSRLMSGWTKMWGATGDQMRSKSTFPPTLYTEGSSRRSRLDSRKGVGSEHEPLNEEIKIVYRQDDDGNNGNDDDGDGDDDDDDDEEVSNDNGRNKEEMIVGDDDDDQTQAEEKNGHDSDQHDDDSDDDHGENTKKKKNNKKKNMKKRRRKT